MGPRIVIRIDAENMTSNDFRRVQSQLNRLDRGLGRTERQSNRTRRSFDDMADSMLIVGAISGQVAQALTGFVTSLVTAAGRIEGFRDAFTALTGSARLANQEIERMRQVARLPGVTFEQAVRAQIILTGLGVAAGDSASVIGELGNALALSGGTAVEFGRALRGLQQIVSRGNVQQEEINQITEAVPIFPRILQRAFGGTQAEDIRAIVGEGRDAVLNNFLPAITRAFQQEGRASVDGFNNSVLNLGNSFFELRASLGESFLPVVTRLLQALTGLIDAIKDANEATGGFIGDLTLVGTALGGILVIFGSINLALPALTTGAKAFATALAPILGLTGGSVPLLLLGAAGIAGIITLVRQLNQSDDSFREARESARRFNEELAKTSTIAGARTNIQQRITDIEKLSETLARSFSGAQIFNRELDLNDPFLGFSTADITEVLPPRIRPQTQGNDAFSFLFGRRAQEQPLNRQNFEEILRQNPHVRAHLFNIQSRIRRGEIEDLIRQAEYPDVRDILDPTELGPVGFRYFLAIAAQQVLEENRTRLTGLRNTSRGDFLQGEVTRIEQEILTINNLRDQLLTAMRIDPEDATHVGIPNLAEELRVQLQELGKGLTAARSRFENFNNEQEKAAIITRNYALDVFNLSSSIDEITRNFNNAALSNEELNRIYERGLRLIEQRRDTEIQEASRILSTTRRELQIAESIPDAQRTDAQRNNIDRLRATLRRQQAEVTLANARIEQNADAANRSLTDAYQDELDRRAEADRRANEERIREEERLQERLRQAAQRTADYVNDLRSRTLTIETQAAQASLQSFRDIQSRATDPTAILDTGAEIRRALQQQRDLEIEAIDPNLTPEQFNLERLRITEQYNRLILQNYRTTGEAINQVYTDLTDQLDELQSRQNERVDRNNNARFQSELRATQDYFTQLGEFRVSAEARITEAQAAIETSRQRRIDEIIQRSTATQAQIKLDNAQAGESVITALLVEEQRRANEEIEQVNQESQTALTNIVDRGTSERNRIRRQRDQEYFNFYSNLIADEQRLEQGRIRFQEGQLSALQNQANQLGRRGLFGTSGLVDNFRQQSQLLRDISQQEIDALQNQDITPQQAALERGLLNQQLDAQLSSLEQRAQSGVNALLTPLFSGAQDFGALLADIFRNLDVQANQELADLEAETQRRIQQVRDDQTIGAQQQARRIERIEQQSAERRIQIEQDLNRAKRESFDQFVQNFLQGIARQISAELQLRAVRSVTSAVLDAGLIAGLSTAGPGAAALVAASAGISFLSNLSFHNEANDMLARQAGRQSTQRLLERNAARLGRESAHDIVDNFQEGFEDQASTGRGSSNNIIIPRDTMLNINFPIGDQVVQGIQIRADELISEGRL